MQQLINQMKQHTNSAIYAAPGVPALYDKYDVTIVRQDRKVLTTDEAMNTIANIVCNAAGETLERYRTKSRKGELVEVRQLIMFFNYIYTTASLSRIGKHAGGRDHSTAIHSIKTVQNLMTTDNNYAYRVEALNYVIRLHVTEPGNMARPNFESVWAMCRKGGK